MCRRPYDPYTYQLSLMTGPNLAWTASAHTQPALCTHNQHYPHTNSKHTFITRTLHIRLASFPHMQCQNKHPYATKSTPKTNPSPRLTLGPIGLPLNLRNRFILHAIDTTHTHGQHLVYMTSNLFTSIPRQIMKLITLGLALGSNLALRPTLELT